MTTSKKPERIAYDNEQEAGGGLRMTTSKAEIYYANGNEVQLFERAYRQRLPVMLTGPPTGCGKTRLVEHMGTLLGRPRRHHQLP